MRINTDGKKAYRNDLSERTADKLGENTKTGGIDAACIHANQDLDAKGEALDFLAERLSAEDLTEVAGILSTDTIDLSAAGEIGVSTE